LSGIFALQRGREDGVRDGVVHMARISVVVLYFRVNMDEWYEKHPYGHPCEERHARPRRVSRLRLHCGFQPSTLLVS
jgi:hypothetical protein